MTDWPLVDEDPLASLAAVIIGSLRTDIRRYCSEIVADATLELDAATAARTEVARPFDDTVVMAGVSTEQMLTEFDSIFASRESILLHRAWAVESILTELSVRSQQPVDAVKDSQSKFGENPTPPARTSGRVAAEVLSPGTGPVAGSQLVAQGPAAPVESEPVVDPSHAAHKPRESAGSWRPEWLINAAVIGLTLAVVSMVLAVMGAF